MKKTEKNKHFNLLLFKMILAMVCIWGVGCAGPPPGFEQVKAELEKRLEADRGNLFKGNADIYAIASLTIVNQNMHGDDNVTLEFQGEVECLTGFYMAEDGKYSIAKPSWKARRHVTRGSRIGFTGTANYSRSMTRWDFNELYTTMGHRYAPPM